MNHIVGHVVLRRPEPRDIEALYAQKNDPAVANLLGGFSLGYSRRDIENWIEAHRARRDEVIWVIADQKSDTCHGHVGIYNIDGRIRSGEFAIMIGDKGVWSQGLGTDITRYVLDYAFSYLNLNRIHLTVLATNTKAIALYEKLGFQHEGVMRQAQFKQGAYVDVVVMGKLRGE